MYYNLTLSVWIFLATGFIAWLVSLSGVHNTFVIGGIAGLVVLWFNATMNFIGLKDR